MWWCYCDVFCMLTCFCSRDCLFSAICHVSFSRCVCQYSFVLCLNLRFSTCWRLVLSTICVISWWIVIWSRDIYIYIYIYIYFNRISTVIDHFHFFAPFKNMFKMFCNTTEIKSFVFISRFGSTSLDETSESKIQVTTGLDVEMSVRHDFWIFDDSFTYIKRIKIMITPIIMTNLIYWCLWMSKFGETIIDEFVLFFRILKILIFFLCSLDRFWKKTYWWKLIYATTLEVTIEILTWFLLLIVTFLIRYRGDKIEEKQLFNELKEYDIRRHSRWKKMNMHRFLEIFAIESSFECTIFHTWALLIFRIELEQLRSSTEEIFRWISKTIHRGEKKRSWIERNWNIEYHFSKEWHQIWENQIWIESSWISNCNH